MRLSHLKQKNRFGSSLRLSKVSSPTTPKEGFRDFPSGVSLVSSTGSHPPPLPLLFSLSSLSHHTPFSHSFSPLCGRGPNAYVHQVPRLVGSRRRTRRVTGTCPSFGHSA